MKTLLLLVMIAAGCASTNPWKQLAPYPDQYGLNRYENKETVCYLFQTPDNSTMQCRFKKNTNQ